MDYKELEKEFNKFKTVHKDRTLSLLGDFLNKMRITFMRNKSAQWKKSGFSESEAQNKSRQGWVSFVGSSLEKIVASSLEDFCQKYNLRIIKDKNLKNVRDGEHDLVKRAIMVHFEEYALLPDADMIIYKYQEKIKKVNIICILSVKNSFRERYTETPFWKLKLKENPNTKAIRVFMITPDNDDEISFIRGEGDNKKPRKARIVMEYELDGIYLAKEQFDESAKVKSINDLQKDILKIIS